MTTQSDAGAVNAALRDPVPELQPSESLTVTLQRGLVDPSTGTWFTDAEVREMTGADEEYLATMEAKNSVTYAEYMSTLIKRTTTRVGNMVIADNPAILDNLTIGDRDILFLAIIKATYGKVKDFRATCGNCEEVNDVQMNLDEDFPIQEPTIDLRSPLVHTLRNGSTVKLRIPTTADNAAVAKSAQTPSSQNTLILAKCSVWDEGKQPADLEAWAKSLNVADRGKLVRSLLDVKAGPKLEAVNVPCAHCGEEMTISLDWISLLLG